MEDTSKREKEHPQFNILERWSFKWDQDHVVDGSRGRGKRGEIKQTVKPQEQNFKGIDITADNMVTHTNATCAIIACIYPKRTRTQSLSPTTHGGSAQEH